MGQTNLLVIVFSAVIVSVAIILGIELYQNHVRSANENALRRDILVMMNATAEWYARPTMYKGGGRDFDNLKGFENLGYYYNADYTPTSGLNYVNENGSYRMMPGDDELVIIGELAQDPEIYVAYKIYANQMNFTLDIVEVTEELTEL